MLKNRILKAAFLFQIPALAFALSSTSPVIGGLPLEQNHNVSSYLPQNIKLVPEVLISRPEYLISYNRETRLLNWAAWEVDASDIGLSGRTNNFLPDPDLQLYLAAFGKTAVDATDFKGSCFDRGHQVPSGDRTETAEMNQMTFLMSNMIPQTAHLNRFIWEHLESYTRDLVENQHKKVYIVAGPIYDEDFGKIGPNHDIPVPSKNFKVIVVLDENQDIQDINDQTEVISVIMPNRLLTGEKPLDNVDELCKEAHPENPKPPTPVEPPAPPPIIDMPDQQSSAPPPSGPPPVPTPRPSLPTDPVVTPVAPKPYVPHMHVLNDDWKQYQTSLEEIERLSGFKLRP